MRAIVADMAPTCRRGSAFGYYNAVFGIAWFTGSVLIGLLFDLSLLSMVVLAVGLQLSSIPMFIYVKGESRNWKRKKGRKAH